MNITAGRKYIVKDDKLKLGHQFHYLIGKVVTVTSEETVFDKYPISYDFETPKDSISLPAQRIRGDLLEEIE